jgi:flagellar protein FlgJ
MRGGKPANNLFGIKADSSWKGKVAEVTTTEYVNGVAEKKVAKFRAYDSYDESFRDYARLITQSPRYAKASQQTGSALAFASGLQKAGYATDPNYAAKLSRAIETTQRLQQRTQIVAQSI